MKLRGEDILYNPVFFAYAIVTPASATLYLQKEGQTSDVATHLGGKVQMQSYDAIFDAIQGLASASGNQVYSFVFLYCFSLVFKSGE